MAFYQDMPFHEGEEKMQQLMNVGHLDNPTVPALSPQLSRHLQIAPLMAIGTLDKEGRPWTTLWGGDPGFARPLGGGIVGFRLPVTGQYDPVVEELFGKEATGEVRREEEGTAHMVGGLTIDLETRKRVKMCATMLAGALSTREDEVTGHDEKVAEVQLVVQVKQSLGNCPKYLNSKHIVPTFSRPSLEYEGHNLSQKAQDLVAKADLFFLSSSQKNLDMDTNHRGGPQGFLRVVSAGSNDEPASVVWPEYSGNRLYQTLGNLTLNPYCGICVPDFETGDMLYLTGTTEIFTGKDASLVLPKSNLCVKLTVTSARFVTEALPFRGVEGQRSPYNPVVRYLTSEKQPLQQSQELQRATLLSQTKLTPTVSRFRFHLANGVKHKAGQYVTLDFSKHLDVGYSHMRDDDPRSLNDDYVRTFTVSSPPGDPPNPVRRLKDDEFEITVRNVGVVTAFLFKHSGSEASRGGRGYGELEVDVKGFGGEFEIAQKKDEETAYFIAAGVGITPLLPSLGMLDYSRLKTLWSLRKDDLSLALDVLEQHPDFGRTLTVFITDSDTTDESRSATVDKLKDSGAIVQLRRMRKEDVASSSSQRYYLCTSVPMRKQLMQWLEGKELVFEDFNF